MPDEHGNFKGIAIPRIPYLEADAEEIHELCPICEGEAADEYGECVNCNGLGLVDHDCPDG